MRPRTHIHALFTTSVMKEMAVLPRPRARTSLRDHTAPERGIIQGMISIDLRYPSLSLVTGLTDLEPMVTLYTADVDMLSAPTTVKVCMAIVIIEANAPMVLIDIGMPDLQAKGGPSAPVNLRMRVTARPRTTRTSWTVTLKRERSPALTSATCRACNPVARGVKGLTVRAPDLAVDHDDSIMGTISFEGEDQEICCGTADDTKGAMDPTLDTADLVTTGGETLGPLNLTDGPAGPRFGAPAIEMPSSDRCGGRARLDVEINATLASAALTSTWQLRPGRAWNPRRQSKSLPKA